METPTTIKDHPLHPMLVVIPLGLWLFSLICQLIALGSDNPEWTVVARYCAIGGIIGALLAAIPGFIDLFSMKERRLRSKGTTHMVLNLVVTVLWIIVGYLLQPERLETGWAFFLSLIGMLILSYSGWIGADLVHVNHVGVVEEHHHEETYTRRVPADRRTY